MAKKDMILLSEFIRKLKNTATTLKNQGGDQAKTTKTETLITMLEQNLKERGDFEFDLDKMLKHFGV
jgi:hypothetical protein